MMGWIGTLIITLALAIGVYYVWSYTNRKMDEGLAKLEKVFIKDDDGKGKRK